MNPHAQAIREWFGGEPAPYRVLVELYRAKDPLTARDLGMLTCRTPAAVRQSIRQLRSAMDPGSVRTGEDGYRLTVAGMKDCDRALLDAATRERSA